MRSLGLFRSLTRVLLKKDQIKMLRLQRCVNVVEAWTSSDSDEYLENRRSLDWLIEKERNTGPITRLGESRITQQLAYGVYGRRIMMEPEGDELGLVTT